MHNPGWGKKKEVLAPVPLCKNLKRKTPRVKEEETSRSNLRMSYSIPPESNRSYTVNNSGVKR